MELVLSYQSSARIHVSIPKMEPVKVDKYVHLVTEKITIFLDDLYCFGEGDLDSECFVTTH